MSGPEHRASAQTPPLPEAARIGGCFRESVDLRFPVTASGRLRAGRAVVPRFYFGRSLATTLWRFGETLDREAVQQLSRLAALEDAFSASAGFPDSIPAPPERLHAMARILEGDSRGPGARRALLFQLDSPGPTPRDIGAEIVPVSAVENARGEGRDGDGGPFVPGRSLWIARIDGAEVARVFALRGSLGSAVELRVETRESHRGRGLGTTLFARASLAAEDRGERVFASLPWPDRRARLFAERLGMQAIGEDCFVY